MWIYTRPRNENDNRFLLNLDLCSRVNVSQLGEKWFVEVILGSESFPVAAMGSREEAVDIVQQVFDSLKADEKALDLAAPPEKGGDRQQTARPPEKDREPVGIGQPPAPVEHQESPRNSR